MNDFFKWWGDEISRDSFVGYVLLFLTGTLAFGATLAFMLIVAIAALGIWQPLSVVAIAVGFFISRYIYRAYAQSRKEK